MGGVFVLLKFARKLKICYIVSMTPTITIPAKLRIPSQTKVINLQIPLYLDFIDSIEEETDKDWSKLDNIKGLLAGRKNIDPVEYQKKIRSEWD